jgi:8-oxo-dGTP diphosphatase|tara:strand:- start:12 stop:389 length:378 start_codon:yes stop_codon:yes gene_type:complete
VGAVILSEGRLLLVKRANEPHRGSWSIPGGRLISGESWQAAAEREVLEETGLTATCGPLLGWVNRKIGNDLYIIADFSATVAYPEAATAGDDATELGFFLPSQIKEIDLSPGLAPFLQEHGFVGA